VSTADATSGAVLEEIAEMIREVIGEEWARETEIGRETSFGADLELESIEMVALGERIQGRWPSVDFATWLSRLSLDDLVGLRVGDLADYIAACL
jgi:acyl carrier protein